MKNTFTSRFTGSLLELRRPATLAACAMLIALQIVVSMFFTFDITVSLRIGFAYLIMAMYSSMFGPAVGGLAAAAADILVFAVRPSGPFVIGFTLVEAAQAMLYGFCFYKRRITLARVVIAQSLVAVLVHLLFNTAMISFTYGSPFWGIFPPRLIKNLILFPLETALLYFVMKAFEQVLARVRGGKMPA